MKKWHAANGVPSEVKLRAPEGSRFQLLEMPDEVPGSDQSEVLGATVEGVSTI
jgi:hypothetical protein